MISPRADLLVQREDRVHQRLGTRRTAGRVDVHGHDLIDSLDDGVVVEQSSGRCAHAHGDDPLRFHHLVVDLTQDRRHLLADATGDDHEVGLARRVAKDLHAVTREVEVGTTGRHHLNGATREAEGGRPHRSPSRPAHDVLEGTSEEVVLEVFEGHDYAARSASELMRRIVDELVREGRPGTRCFTGPHDSAPSATRKSSAPKTVTENVSISTRPKRPS